jgi:hypothetical protein
MPITDENINKMTTKAVKESGFVMGAVRGDHPDTQSGAIPSVKTPSHTLSHGLVPVSYNIGSTSLNPGKHFSDNILQPLSYAGFGARFSELGNFKINGKPYKKIILGAGGHPDNLINANINFASGDEAEEYFEKYNNAGAIPQEKHGFMRVQSAAYNTNELNDTFHKVVATHLVMLSPSVVKNLENNPN